MRVLYLGMHFGGSYNSPSHEALQARSLAEMGHDVTFVVNQPPPWKKPNPPKLHEIVLPVDEALQRGRYDLLQPMVGDDFDVAFASSASGAPFLASWKRSTGRPAVTQVLDFPMWRLKIDGGPWRDQWRPWFQALGAMDQVVFNTNVNRVHAESACKIYGKDVGFLGSPKVVYYGIDTEAIDEALAAPGAARISGAPFQCCSTSRLVFYKGFDFGIMGLSRVAAHERPAYAIVGEGEDHARLAQMASLLDVNVGFAGGCSDFEKGMIMKGSSFGLALAWNPEIPYQCPGEVVYSGRPCIIADTAINRERYGNHGVTYVDPFDPVVVGAAVTDIVRAGPPNGYDAKREAAWIKEHRSFRSHAEGVVEVLENVTR